MGRLAQELLRETVGPLCVLKRQARGASVFPPRGQKGRGARFYGAYKFGLYPDLPSLLFFFFVSLLV